MNLFIPLIVAIVALGVGSVLGYYARQSIAKKRIGTIEQKLQEKISQAKKECETILSQAQDKASVILGRAKKEEDHTRGRLIKAEQILLKRENILVVDREVVRLYDTNPWEFLSYCRQDLNDDSERGRTNALSNAKRAIECRADEIIKILKLNLQTKRNLKENK